MNLMELSWCQWFSFVIVSSGLVMSFQYSNNLMMNQACFVMTKNNCWTSRREVPKIFVFKIIFLSWLHYSMEVWCDWTKFERMLNLHWLLHFNCVPLMGLRFPSLLFQWWRCRCELRIRLCVDTFSKLYVEALCFYFRFVCTLHVSRTCM
jgi:hypothetical protein